MLSYTLQPDCTIAAPSIGLDPVRNPAAFRRALRARLELVTGPTSTRQARAQNVDAIAPGGMYKQQTELLDKSCLESPEKSLRPSVSNVAPESIHSSSQGRDDERIEGEISACREMKYDIVHKSELPENKSALSNELLLLLWAVRFTCRHPRFPSVANTSQQTLPLGGSMLLL